MKVFRLPAGWGRWSGFSLRLLPSWLLPINSILLVVCSFQPLSSSWAAPCWRPASQSALGTEACDGFWKKRGSRQVNLMDGRYGGICDLIPDEPVRAERPFSVADERQDVIFAPFLGS